MFAVAVIRAVQALAPNCRSHVKAPGEDQDYVPLSKDMEQLEPDVVKHMTL